MNNVEKDFHNAKLHVLQQTGRQDVLEQALNIQMPELNFDNYNRITFKALKNTPNDWVYPHIDTVRQNHNPDHMYKGELTRFLNNYNSQYALKNKAQILRIMFGLGNQTNLHPMNFGLLGEGAMKNQEVKKCEKKVVLGKERCIYKVSGSKKDYMKYKGKLVPVTDYIKYMKKKN
jgi:hypothetical protein